MPALLSRALALIFVLSAAAPGVADAQAPDAPRAAVPLAARTAVLRQDRAGRPTIAATVNGRGPFEMVLDTGAQTSVIAPALAQELGLAPLPGRSIDVIGASGQAAVALYPVDELTTDLFSARFVALPGLPNEGATSARGILGMAPFATGKLSFDHGAGRVRFDASSPAAPGLVAVQGRRDASGLLEVPLTIHGSTFHALVDTGASTTVANWALVQALGWQRDDPRLKAAGAIRGATAAGTRVLSARLDDLQIGPARLSGVTIVVTDAAGDDAPSLLLGIDVLGALSVYALDFPRAELQIGVSVAAR